MYKLYIAIIYISIIFPFFHYLYFQGQHYVNHFYKVCSINPLHTGDCHVHLFMTFLNITSSNEALENFTEMFPLYYM